MNKLNLTNMSLTRTVVFILLVITILIQTTVGGIFYIWQRSLQYKNLHIQLQQVTEQAGRNLEAPMWNIEKEQIQQIVQTLMLIPTVDRITVKDFSEKILFHQTQDNGGLRNKAQVYSQKRGIFRNDQQLGSVEVSLSTDLTNQGLLHYLMNIIFSTLILAVVQISTLYLLLRKTIILPLKAIENFAASISSQTATLPDPPKGLFYGELKHLLSSITDMVQALHTSEQSYRSIFENSLEGIFQTTQEGRFVKANPALADILGYNSVKEVLETVTRLDKQLYIDSGRRKELLEIIKYQGFVLGQEVALRHRDGRTLHCLVSMHVIRNNRGEIDYLEGSLIDISERKLAEEQLASLNQRLESLVEQRTEQLNRRNAELIASEERYRSLVETMQEGIMAIDEEGSLTYVNKQMSTMLGTVPDELIGRECTCCVEAKDEEVFKTKLKGADGRFASKFEMTFIRSDGHIVSTLVTPTTIYDGEGHYRGSFAVVTDITNLKQLQSQLLHSQKLESIGQLAAGIAHEINTPTQYVVSNARFLDDAFKELVEILAAYESLLEAIKKGLSLSTALEEVEMSREDHQLESLMQEISGAFHDTFEGLERISSIVSSVKQFAHPGQDATALADLNDAIRNTITISTNEWKYVANVDTDLDPDLSLVPCNISAINQVVLNLIVNAAHAITQQNDSGAAGKGTITVQTRNCGDFAEIRITDTGGGIPENIRSRIFDPFFTTKSVGKGSGQGLAIARTIVTEAHHGSIDFETDIGCGTTFIVRLPVRV